MSKLIENAMSLDWGFIMSTLIIRFFGVFAVLAVVMIGMIILGKVVSKLVAMQEAKEAKDHDEPEEELLTDSLAETPEHKAGEEEIVAAIGAALAFAMESQRKTPAAAAHGGVTAGSWAMAGRAALMSGRLQAGSQKHLAQSRS